MTRQAANFREGTCHSPSASLSRGISLRMEKWSHKSEQKRTVTWGWRTPSRSEMTPACPCSKKQREGGGTSGLEKSKQGNDNTELLLAFQVKVQGHLDFQVFWKSHGRVSLKEKSFYKKKIVKKKKKFSERREYNNLQKNPSQMK